MERILDVLLMMKEDFDFAKKYNIQIKKVIDCDDNQLPYSDDEIS